MVDKIIVTNISALRGKYGPAGLKRIQTSLAALLAADKKRGLESRVVALDAAASMKAFNAAPVTDPSDQEQNKKAIDRVVAVTAPAYVLILGSIDVIPHQDLRNPMFLRDDDDDRTVPSDLPYACDAPYNTRIADFLGPTRVVGRLPDVTGASDATYLVGVLKKAAQAKPLPPALYSKYLGVTAAVWSNSTALSLENVFGTPSDMKSSPSHGPKWSTAQIAPLSHYFNCHGSHADPQFYGQRNKEFSVAHMSSWIDGKIKVGTVASAECCFGAELYNPDELGLPLPIANTYLGGGAYGFFGSTTIAYGPAEGNDQADIICQAFLLRILAGASTGRAALEARQTFVNGAAQLDPVNLKTLAQFNLLGDPSIHPVDAPTADGAKSMQAEDLARAERRAHLKSVGAFLQATKPVTGTGSSKGVPRRQHAALQAIAKGEGLRGGSVRAFKIRRASRGNEAKGISAPSSYLLLQGKLGSRDHEFLAACIVAKVVDGRVVAHRTYHRR